MNSCDKMSQGYCALAHFTVCVFCEVRGDNGVWTLSMVEQGRQQWRKQVYIMHMAARHTVA